VGGINISFSGEDEMRVITHLSGWADTLTEGYPKVKFAIRLALNNAGLGCGYTIDFTSRPTIPGESYVYSKHDFEVVADTITSQGWDLKADEHKKNHETHEQIIFDFTADHYSVREIYKAAYKTLKKKIYSTRKYERNF
jgi:hypothetical protein